MSDPANAKALHQFSTDRSLDLFGFRKILNQQGKQQKGLTAEQQEKLQATLDGHFADLPELKKIYEQVHQAALEI